MGLVVRRWRSSGSGFYSFATATPSLSAYNNGKVFSVSLRIRFPSAYLLGGASLALQRKGIL
tara:strand:- start:81 stop:266 length:186 start_codon:yes stop_codon:yes gene_type:complete